MPKLDEAKERLVSHRFWLGVVVANFLAVIGWIITNYKNPEAELLIAAIIYLCILLVFFVALNKKISILIKEIGRMKK